MTRHRILAGGALLLTCGALLSCASAPRAQPEDTGPMGARFREVGTRMFDFTSPDGLPVISGWFNVTADTIVVRANPGPCSFAGHGPTTMRAQRNLAYTCSEMILHFDPEYPVSRVTLWYPTIKRTTRRVCGNWEVNTRGVRVCTRYELEQVESRVLVSTRLRPRVE